MHSIAGRLVVAFGFQECFDGTICDHVWFNDVWQYHIDLQMWIEGYPTAFNDTLPAVRGFVASSPYYSKTSIVYFGGASFNASSPFPGELLFYNDVWEYFPLEDRWVQRHPNASTGPSPRIGATGVILGHSFYIFGGVDDTFTTRNDFWKYNLLTDTWTLISAHGASGSPPARHSSQMQLRITPSSKWIVMFAGDAPPTGSGIQANDTWIYKINQNVWEELDVEPDVEQGRVYGVSAFYNDIFIVSLGDRKDVELECRTGGSASAGQLPTSRTSYLNFGERNDPDFDYERVPTLTAPRLKRAAGAVSHGKLWVFGGFNFVCPCDQNNGTAIENNRLWTLDLSKVCDHHIFKDATD